jgi:hypothetical protein
MKQINTSTWDKVSKRIVLGLIISALVAAFFLLLGVYIVGAEALAGFATTHVEGVLDRHELNSRSTNRIQEHGLGAHDLNLSEARADQLARLLLEPPLFARLASPGFSSQRRFWPSEQTSRRTAELL